MSKKTDRRVKFSDKLVVVRLASENPKKPGSASRARFDLYPPKGEPKTVAEVLVDGGPTRADLIWDSERGFVAVGTRDELREAGHLA
jgi:hypothetical protein